MGDDDDGGDGDSDGGDSVIGGGGECPQRLPHYVVVPSAKSMHARALFCTAVYPANPAWYGMECIMHGCSLHPF